MAKAFHKAPRRQRFFQYLFLFFFIYLIALATYPSKDPLPLDIFLRLDPLIAIGTSLATWEIIDKAFISLLIIIVTLLLGRVFCGYMCPLGTSIDLGQRIFIKKPWKKKKAFLEYAWKFKKYRPIKYYLLIATLVSAGFGFSLLYIFDPISLITRTCAGFFYPLAIYISNSFLDLIRPLASKFDFVELSHMHFIQPIFAGNLIIFMMFFGIIFLTLFQSRFWCRYLCPLGALLGVCSKTSLLKKHVSDECNNCSQCKIHCPMDAIHDDPKATIQSECIQCETCKTVCPKDAVTFKFKAKEKIHIDDSSMGLSRRAVLNSFFAGFTLSFLGKTNIAKANVSFIRPPGAIPENEFLSRCIRCGECIKSCITNTLQPAAFEAGFEGLWTPVHHMRHAGCEQQCNMCGQVCPTQAVRSLPLAERKYARVGTAVIKRDKCLAWEQNKLCIICDEQCPYNAIVFKHVDGHKRPFVDETKCNGCGICEEKCPIVGESAIVVIPMGEVRLKNGSYIKEAERQKLTFHEEKDELMNTESLDSKQGPSPEAPKKSKLPPGFIMEP